MELCDFVTDKKHTNHNDENHPGAAKECVRDEVAITNGKDRDEGKVESVPQSELQRGRTENLQWIAEALEKLKTTCEDIDMDNKDGQEANLLLKMGLGLFPRTRR